MRLTIETPDHQSGAGGNRSFDLPRSSRVDRTRKSMDFGCCRYPKPLSHSGPILLLKAITGHFGGDDDITAGFRRRDMELAPPLCRMRA